MDLVDNLNISATGIANTATSIALYLTADPKDKRVVFFRNDAETSNGLYVSSGSRTPIFEKFGILSFSVNDATKLAEHPLENGAVVIDHMIPNPSTIKAQLVVDENDTESIDDLLYYYSNGILISIKAGAEFYNNMAIEEKPYEIKSDVFNRIIYNVSLKEVLRANTQFLALPTNKVANPSDSSTKNNGTQQATENKDKSILASVKDKIKGFF